MGRLVGGNARALVLCTLALLWAWEATAEDPDPAATAVAAGEAGAKAPGELSAPQGKAVPAERIRGGR